MDRYDSADGLAINVTDQHASTIVLTIPKMEEYSFASQVRSRPDLPGLPLMPELASEGATNLLEVRENLTLNPSPTINIADDQSGCSCVGPRPLNNALHVVALRIGGDFLILHQF